VDKVDQMAVVAMVAVHRTMMLVVAAVARQMAVAEASPEEEMETSTVEEVEQPVVPGVLAEMVATAL